MNEGLLLVNNQCTLLGSLKTAAAGRQVVNFTDGITIY